MRRKTAVQGKLCLILLGTVILLILGIRHMAGRTDGQKLAEGYYILRTDVIRMTEALSEDADAALSAEDADGAPYITFEEYGALMERLGADAGTVSLNRSYKRHDYLTMEDWLTAYDRLVAMYGMDDMIVERELILLAEPQEITFTDGRTIENDEVYTTDGFYRYGDIDITGLKYQKLRVLMKEKQLLLVKEVLESEYRLKNVWLLRADAEELVCFVDGMELCMESSFASESMQEQVADITFKDGLMSRIDTKEEKVSGKVLRVGSGSVEIEGLGTMAFSEDVKVYCLYGALQQQSLKNIVVGYDFTDFVVVDGRIEACLITRSDAMENIRVLLRTEGFADVYHKELQLTATTEYEVSYGEVSQVYGAGEAITLNAASECFQTGERVYVTPKALTGEVAVPSLKRAQGEPSYRGKLELLLTEEGILAVNELLLEEYLYAVVPSEMPASYEPEALKAQAICARSYARRQMMESGVNQYGAHVDDSTAYQVYNNVEERPETTRAVKETVGQVATHDGQAIYTYYFSTSCGYTTNGQVWQGEDGVDRSHIKGRRVSSAEGEAADMADEETFAAYIAKSHPEDHESGESMYRWSGLVELSDLADISGRLRERYEINRSLILTKTENGYESLPVGELGRIQEISVLKRNEGGVIEELSITGSESAVKVITEYNVRYVLSPAGKELTRANGEPYLCGALLPSAYFTILPVMGDEGLTAIRLTGGGYGHGAGMSQNGANALAKEGMEAADIIRYFYEDVEIENIYADAAG